MVTQCIKNTRKFRCKAVRVRWVTRGEIDTGVQKPPKHVKQNTVAAQVSRTLHCHMFSE